MMLVSIFYLFSVGVGPSSSHTVGTMLAAWRFANSLTNPQDTHRIIIDLYGSLALTGKGHHTDRAILMGLEGENPETINPDTISDRVNTIHTKKKLHLNNQKSICFNPKHDMLFHTNKTLPFHSNGMRFTAFNIENEVIDSQTYYSTGGGFVVSEDEINNSSDKNNDHKLPYPFKDAKTLLALCDKHQLNIHDIMLANEKTWRTESEIIEKINHLANIMSQCIQKGCATPGVLPGVLNLKRRAPGLYQTLSQQGPANAQHPDALNWLNLYAIAVNEENAAGSRIVTAPTNGAAGILPAVLEYYKNFHDKPTPDAVIQFFLTAGAIALLFKEGASFSGAEVGCQGEVGTACSMAAAGITAALGGSPAQVEKAAEMAMEHHLGLTCDPVGGLVQIPCIERNAMGAQKAINAARLSLAEEDSNHHVSLDNVIATMRVTGRDMQTIYKETSLGGLAVNVTEC